MIVMCIIHQEYNGLWKEQYPQDSSFCRRWKKSSISTLIRRRDTALCLTTAVFVVIFTCKKFVYNHNSLRVKLPSFFVFSFLMDLAASSSRTILSYLHGLLWQLVKICLHIYSYGHSAWNSKPPLSWSSKSLISCTMPVLVIHSITL